MAVPGREPAENPEYREVRRPEGIAPSEPVGYFDTIRWGPVFAGVFTALAIMMMLSFLGVAVGLTAGTGDTTSVIASAVWTVISLIIGLFFGGWLAASTSGPSGVWDGIFEGITVWGLAMVIVALAIAFGLGGLFGAFAVADMSTVAGTAWGLFFASLLGLISAIIGGIVGGGREAGYRV